MKRAVVTGGTRGIGLEVCRLLAERDYLVTALYSSDEESASLARALPIEVCRADVGDEAQVEAAFSKIPRLDLLVNNAGISHFCQIQDERLEEAQHVMQVNFFGAMLCTKYAVKRMLSFGGSIVNVASIWGQTGGSCESVYSASKGALISFTKALAQELAPAIRVNCVAPGVIDTAMNARFSEEERRALSEAIPLGRFGTAEEVARAVLFLAESAYITGEVLGVNGGMTL